MSEECRNKVLITGANGFVGSRLCRRMLADGYQVIAGVREGCNREMLAGLKMEFRYGDVTRPETLAAMVAGVDYIIHNAGVVKAIRPELFYRVNHFGTRNIAEAALTNSGLKKFVFISSLAAAGPSDSVRPLSETDPPHPVTEYGRSKLAGEEALLELKDRLPIVIIRPPGVYGPGDREMYAIFKMVNFRLRPLLGNLNRKIQLVHVDDLCRGVAAALKSETPGGAIYFVAENRAYSFRELVSALGRAVDRKGIPLYLPGGLVRLAARLSQGVMKLFGRPPMFTVEKADEILGSWEVATRRAERELGFQAEIAFPDGARETMAWYRKEGWL